MPFEDEAYYDQDPRRTLALSKALKLLADGEWHDRDEIIEAVMPAVPHGIAYRDAERNRINLMHKRARERLTPEEYEKWKEDPANLARRRPRTQDEIIRMGRRQIVSSLLGNSTRIESRVGEDGRRQLRRVPLYGRARLSQANRRRMEHG